MTNGAEQPDREPPTSGETEPFQEPKARSGRRRSFAKTRRELNDDDLANPVVAKLLLDEIDRLEGDAEWLRPFQEKFHSAELQVASLTERQKRVASMEIIATASLTIGAAILGFAPSQWSDQPNGWICLSFGGTLVVAGILAKKVSL